VLFRLQNAQSYAVHFRWWLIPEANVGWFPSHVDHCMQDLADCEHPWESEFSEPRSMPISASAGASDSEEHLVAVQGRLFEHSRFWIEELEVSEFVRGIILHGTNYHSGHSLLHYFPKIICQLSSMLSLFRML